MEDSRSPGHRIGKLIDCSSSLRPKWAMHTNLDEIDILKKTDLTENIDKHN